MLEIILGIFGSGGFGSIVGVIGGYFNRKLDIEAKRIDLEDHKEQRAHDLLKQEADRKYMESEYAQKIQVSTIEAEKAVEVAGYGAMAESYKFAATTSKDGWVDTFSKAVRPIITLCFLLGSIIIFWELQKAVDALQSSMHPKEILKLYILVIEWILFQAGICIGWWFAMRPGKMITLERK